MDPGPGEEELATKLMARLADSTKTENIKANQAAIEEILKLKNVLTRIATRIKKMGKMGGATPGETVEVAVAQGASRRFLIAGLNSSAGSWTPEQLRELARLGIHTAPVTKGLRKKQPHAEENIMWELEKLKARGLKWSNAPVGAGKEDSDVCPSCRAKIHADGGSIEPGMHEDTVPPVLPRGQRYD